jgi:transporter family-2 protein
MSVACLPIAAAAWCRDRVRGQGAGVVLSALLATPRLGAATTVMLSVTGQMAARLLIDHHGWPGVPERPVDLVRVLGGTCLALGVMLIRWR